MYNSLNITLYCQYRCKLYSIAFSGLADHLGYGLKLQWYLSLVVMSWWRLNSFVMTNWPSKRMMPCDLSWTLKHLFKSSEWAVTPQMRTQEQHNWCNKLSCIAENSAQDLGNWSGQKPLETPPWWSQHQEWEVVGVVGARQDGEVMGRLGRELAGAQQDLKDGRQTGLLGIWWSRWVRNKQGQNQADRQ